MRITYVGFKLCSQLLQMINDRIIGFNQYPRGNNVRVDIGWELLEIDEQCGRSFERNIKVGKEDWIEIDIGSSQI